MTWLTRTSRVRAVTRAEDRLEASPGRRSGRDRRDHDPRPVARRNRAHGIERRVVLVVVGQELVARLEPERPQDRVDARRRVRTKAEPSGSAPRNAADARGAPRRASAGRSRTGTERARLPSARATPAGASRTGSGQAPYEPWLRNVTSGSRRQPRSVRIGTSCGGHRRRRVGVLPRASRTERHRWSGATLPVRRPSPAAAIAQLASALGRDRAAPPRRVHRLARASAASCPCCRSISRTRAWTCATLGRRDRRVAGRAPGRRADLRLARRSHGADPAHGHRPGAGGLFTFLPLVDHRAARVHRSCARSSASRPPSTTRPRAAT